MDTKKAKKVAKEDDIDDEICRCGHSHGYHKPRDDSNPSARPDVHGGKCELCDCEKYFWNAFVKYRDVTFDKSKKRKDEKPRPQRQRSRMKI